MKLATTSARIVALCGVVVLWAVAVDGADSTTLVTGRIVDQKGNGLKKATIRVFATGTTTPCAKSDSNANGEFHFLVSPEKCGGGLADIRFKAKRCHGISRRELSLDQPLEFPTLTMQCRGEFPPVQGIKVVGKTAGKGAKTLGSRFWGGLKKIFGGGRKE